MRQIAVSKRALLAQCMLDTLRCVAPFFLALYTPKISIGDV